MELGLSPKWPPQRDRGEAGLTANVCRSRITLHSLRIRSYDESRCQCGLVYGVIAIPALEAGGQMDFVNLLAFLMYAVKVARQVGGRLEEAFPLI